jgi:hypothetical protein
MGHIFQQNVDDCIKQIKQSQPDEIEINVAVVMLAWKPTDALMDNILFHFYAYVDKNKNILFLIVYLVLLSNMEYCTDTGWI